MSTTTMMMTPISSASSLLFREEPTTPASTNCRICCHHCCCYSGCGWSSCASCHLRVFCLCPECPSSSSCSWSRTRCTETAMTKPRSHGQKHKNDQGKNRTAITRRYFYRSSLQFEPIPFQDTLKRANPFLTIDLSITASEEHSFLNDTIKSTCLWSIYKWTYSMMRKKNLKTSETSNKRCPFDLLITQINPSE